MCVFGRESLNNQRLRYLSYSLEDLCVIADCDRYSFLSSPHSEWSCSRRRACPAHCSRRNLVSRIIGLFGVAETDGLRVKQATLRGCIYQPMPDKITIFRYLCVPLKRFVYSRGRFWYGRRLLIRNVYGLIGLNYTNTCLRATT